MPRPRWPRERLAPVTLYRYGTRTDAARGAHTQQAGDSRARALTAMFPPRVVADLLGSVRSGVSVRDAADSVGVTYQGVYALAQRDQVFGEALDAATTAGCVCGGTGWRRERRGGRRCDCPTAREYRSREQREYRERQRIYGRS